MKPMQYVTAAFLALTLIAGSARADDAKPKMDWSKPLSVPTTQEVKAACEAKDDVNQSYCYGVLLGLYDSNFYVSDALEAQPLCIPETTTPAQMRDAFLDMTKKRSDQLLGPISIFYYMAMDAEYPCANAQPKTPNQKSKQRIIRNGTQQE